MSRTEADRTDPADTADHDPSREARKPRATESRVKSKAARPGAETDHPDTAALERCIRADLWP